jgi:hypothetical protein|tara:strand:+ start:1453 stop:1998 length:546 start_codon:yes stop_codon:yes gene_type:complete
MKNKLSIHDKLSNIQTRLKAKKSRFNSFGKYYFRSAEDILESIKPYLTEYGVTVTVNEEFISGDVPVIKSVATISDKFDNSIQATAIVGVDLNQKGMQVPQQFGSASSYGKKYALGNLFLIDDTQDSDATNNHGKASKPWLKKESDSFDKAVDYVKAGGKVEAIKNKYTLAPELEQHLNSL